MMSPYLRMHTWLGGETAHFPDCGKLRTHGFLQEGNERKGRLLPPVITSQGLCHGVRQVPVSWKAGF
jgi:hypothetical protein